MPLMRAISRLAVLAGFALPLATAGVAHADKLLFSGTHAIKFSHNGEIKEVPPVIAAKTGVAIANGSSGPLNTLQLTRHFAKITETVMGVPGVGIDEIRFEGVRIYPQLKGPNGLPGVFAPIHAAAAQGMTLTKSTLPAAGMIRICNVIGCPGSVAVSLTQTNGAGAAIGPGVGGTFVAVGMTGTGTMEMSGPTVTVMGNPWTVNTTMVSYQTMSGGIGMFSEMGFACGPAGLTTMGSGCAVNGNGTTLNVTPMGMGGILQLVSGIQTTCAGCGGNNTPSGQITRLTIKLEPEPARLALLGSGAAGLALLGRTRRAKRR